MEAGPLEGTLRITEECVLLGLEKEDVLLVWHAGRTRWNDKSGTLTVEKRQGEGESVTIADGDRVNMGGGWGKFESEKPVPSIDWVSAPAPGCRTDTFWVVGSLKKAPTS